MPKEAPGAQGRRGRSAASRAARREALHRQLVEERDSLRRARIHLELAHLALAERSPEQAIRHLREALHFDPQLEAARRVARRLGLTEWTSQRRGEGRRGLRGLLRRVARRRGR